MVLCSSSCAVYQSPIIISIYYPEVRITVNSDIFARSFVLQLWLKDIFGIFKIRDLSQSTIFQLRR